MMPTDPAKEGYYLLDLEDVSDVNRDVLPPGPFVDLLEVQVPGDGLALVGKAPVPCPVLHLDDNSLSGKQNNWRSLPPGVLILFLVQWTGNPS
jgi:hypothetical protein